MLEVRRGVGTEEETIRAAGDRLTQRFLMDIALEDRQAEQVWANASDQHVVAVEHQVLWRDGGAEETIACLHILRRFFGGDVLEDDLQLRELLADRFHHLLDKARLAVEDIDGRVGHFAVDQQRHADFCICSNSG